MSHPRDLAPAAHLRPYGVVARNIDPDADNAIHSDDVARDFGFTGALVPGVELFAYAADAALLTWGEPWLTGGRLALRFRRPVYDGELLRITVDTDDLGLVGPDDVRRAVGVVAGPAPVPAVDLSAWPAKPAPDVPLPPEPAALPPGPLGTVREQLGLARAATYLDLVTSPAGPCRELGLLHPGLLLRAVNLVLMRNVALGPWIHTSSDAVLLAPAAAPAELEVRAVVGSTEVRNGHDVVHYDALVLADGRPVMRVDHTAIYRLGSR